MSNLISLITRNKYKLITVVLLLLLGIYFYKNYSNNSNANLVYTSPKLDTITEVVEVSGPVKASSEADLSFEKSGNLASLNVKVGDNVKAGAVIASLSAAESYASVSEAKAALDAQVANLNLIKSGSTNEEVAIRQQALENAKADLANTESQAQDVISNTYNNISDILNFKLSALFTKGTNAYSLNSPACDQAAQSRLELDRYALDTVLVKINALSGTNVSADDKLTSLYGYTQEVNNLIKSAGNYYAELCASSDPSFNDERSVLSTIKPIISSIVAEINTKKSQLLSNTNAITRAEKDLSLSTASTDNNKIKSAEAAVSQARARLQSAQAQAGKNLLVSPFAGIITKVDIVKGELASAGKPIISIMSESNFEIEVKLSEVDVVKVKVGQDAKVALDAYGRDVKFDAVITKVDPAATTDNGQSSYKATLAFKNKDERVRSGMNATVEIETMKKENVLTLPVGLVNFKNGGAIVTVKNASTTEDKIIKTGVRSSGKVEIIEGLTEKDQVVAIPK